MLSLLKFTPLIKWLAIIALVVCTLFEVYHTGYKSGANAIKVVVEKQIQKSENNGTHCIE